MTDDQKNDGTATLSDQREMNSEPLGERSDVISMMIEGEGRHLTGAPQGGPGATRVTFEELSGDQRDAVQEGESFYEELARYDAEREPETTSWEKTTDDPLPRDESTTAND